MKSRLTGPGTWFEECFDAMWSVFIWIVCLYDPNIRTGAGGPWRAEVDDAEGYVGGFRGSHPPQGAREELDQPCYSSDVRQTQAWQGGGHLEKYINPVRPAETLINPSPSIRQCPANLTRAIFYMVPGLPPYSSFRRNCTGKGKQEEFA